MAVPATSHLSATTGVNEDSVSNRNGDTLNLQRPAVPRRTTTTTRTGLVFRRPGVNPPDFSPPPLQWLSGTWYFTHSTLPIWRDKRNVNITYTIYDEPGSPSPLSSTASPSSPSWGFGSWGSAANKSANECVRPKQERLDDVVEYQEAGSEKVKQVRGKQTESKGDDTRAWDWRGKGIIKVASSHWEILGWGENVQEILLEDERDGASNGSGTTGPGRIQWMVTYFIKTVFTPAALDIYCRTPDGLSEQSVKEIKDALLNLQDPEMTRLVKEMYTCKHDNGPRGTVVQAKD